MKMDSHKEIQWEVQKYGKITSDHDSEVPNTRKPLRLKTYYYNEKNYIELWECGYCIHFSEAI